MLRKSLTEYKVSTRMYQTGKWSCENDMQLLQRRRRIGEPAILTEVPSGVSEHVVASSQVHDAARKLAFPFAFVILSPDNGHTGADAMRSNAAQTCILLYWHSSRSSVLGSPVTT